MKGAAVALGYSCRWEEPLLSQLHTCPKMNSSDSPWQGLMDISVKSWGLCFQFPAKMQAIQVRASETASILWTKETETHRHEASVCLASWSPSLWLHFPNIFKPEEVLPQQKILLFFSAPSLSCRIARKPSSWIPAWISICVFQLCPVKNALDKVILINLTLWYSCSKYHPDPVNDPAPPFILKAGLASFFFKLSSMSEIWKQTERKRS